MAARSFLGPAEPDVQQVLLGADAGSAAYGGAQCGGGHLVAGGVFGDGERAERVAGEGLEDRVAVGGDVGAGAAQRDEEFVDGGARLDLLEGAGAVCGLDDAADGGAGCGGVGEGDEGAVGFDVAEFGVGGGGGAGEVDEVLVPAGGAGAVVVRGAGGQPDEAGCGDGQPASVGGDEPAAAGVDHHGDVVVEGAGPDDGQGAVLEADTEAGEAQALVECAGGEEAHPDVVHRLFPFPAGRCVSKQW
ncbi:hypothetical protein GCM10020227_19860 [Streptomyces flavovirens]